MDLFIPISIDPITQFPRVAQVITFNWDLLDSAIKLNMNISNQFAGKGAKASRIKDYSVQLVCDNNSIVDPKTGEFVLVDGDGIAQKTDDKGNLLPGVGQYDFYTGLAQAGPIDIIGLIKMLVQRADSLKRFDI